MINKNLLRAKIAESGYTQTTLCEMIGMGQNSLSAKMNGKSSFTLEQIDKICDALNINDAETKIKIFLP